MSTPLHMDVEAARMAQSAMNSAWERMDNAITALENSTDGIRNQREWISPSQLEFKWVYESWRSNAKSQIEQLAVLREILGKEILEWESAGGILG